MINKSKTYILPFLTKYIDIKYLKYLINTFVFIEDIDTELIVLSYDKKVNEEFNFEDYQKQLNESNLFIELLKGEDESFNFVFRIPEEFSYDYNCFINGKYSKMNEESKKFIITSVSKMFKIGSNVKSKIRNVLYLGEDLRKSLESELNMIIPPEWELSSIIDTEDETFYEKQ
jgi:hypothetical protein